MRFLCRTSILTVNGDFMDILKVCATSAFSVAVLFFLTKLMGKKQISQLNLFDYINGITIGSIAAEMATSLENDFWLPLTAMIIYTLFSLLISLLERQSLPLNKFFVGNPDILLEDGVLYQKNLQKAHLSVTEFLSQCRVNGFFNLSDIQTAILEPNGSISFLPKSETRPATPADLQLTTTKAEILPNVIVDGKILCHNLRALGLDEIWLLDTLQSQGIRCPADVFLATVDDKQELSAYCKTQEKNRREPFT